MKRKTTGKKTLSLENLSPPAFFFILTGLYLLVLSSPFLQSDINVVHDNLKYHFPVFGYLLASLKHFGTFPLWNPYIGNGLPSILLTNNWFTLLSTRFPIYLIAYLHPNPPDSMLLYKVNLILNAVLLSFFMFLLLREFFDDRKVQYWGVALTLFTGISTINLSFEQIGASTLYIPLILFLFVRLYRTKQWPYALLAGFFLGHSLCNHYPHLVAYALSIFLFSFLLTQKNVTKHLWQERRFWGKALLLIVPVMSIAMLPVLYNYFNFFDKLVSASRLNTMEGSWSWLNFPKGSQSLDFPTLLTYLNAFWGLTYKTPNLFIDKSAYYIGTLGIGFLFYAIFFRFSRVKAFWLLSLFLILMFAIGSYGFIYQLLYQYIPLSRLQRIPLHMGNYLNIPIILLSCMGLAQFLHKKKGQWITLLVVIQLVEAAFILRFLSPKIIDPYPYPSAIKMLDRPILKALPWPRDGYWKVSAQTSYLITFKESVRAKANKKLTGRVQVFDRATRIPKNNRLRSQDLTYDTAKFNIESKLPSLLIWYMNYESGWKATLDGISIPVKKISPILMGVEVPPGKHSVQFRYRPMAQLLILLVHVILLIGSWGLLTLVLNRKIKFSKL